MSTEYVWLGWVILGIIGFSILAIREQFNKKEK